ncbi:hypothetical protein C0993_002087 [Termitomyces sp. T159_Od127]|nr:hypothetical protein C0993_002087 [Termitomyces sp. T159_Od127]
MAMNRLNQSQRSHFVDDLVYLVLESSDHWWPGDLARLAQVSSAWLGPVRQRLFAFPIVHSFRASTRLARTFSDNPSLITLVKGVELRPLPVDGRPVDSQDRASLNMILGIDGLKRIILGGLLSVRAERFLHRITDAQSVLNLHIDGSLMANSISLADCPSFNWDESLAFQFCNLKSLHLNDIELTISHPPIPYQLSLSELQFDHVAFTRGYITQLLHETPYLRHLRVKSTQTSELDEQIRCVLDSCAVEILEIEVDVEGQFEHPIFDNPSPSLRSLTLTGVHVDIDTLTSIGIYCQNLENLAISGRMVAIVTSEWVSFIASGHLPHLRDLELPWATNSHSSEGSNCSVADRLIQAANLRGIHFHLE